MYSSEANAAADVEALRSTSWAAGANTGVWIPVSQYEGMIKFVYNMGAVTGSVIFKLQDATSGAGAGAADLSPAVATASLSTAGTVGNLMVDKRKVRSHVAIVATVTTGPILACAIVQARNKTS